MGLRIGAPRRIPTSTTTVAARNSITCKKEGWRSAVVTASPMPVLSSAGLFVDSFIDQSPSCARLCCQPYSPTYRHIGRLVSPTVDPTVFPARDLLLPLASPPLNPLPQPDLAGSIGGGTAGLLASLLVRR